MIDKFNPSSLKHFFGSCQCKSRALWIVKVSRLSSEDTLLLLSIASLETLLFTGVRNILSALGDSTMFSRLYSHGQYSLNLFILSTSLSGLPVKYYIGQENPVIAATSSSHCASSCCSTSFRLYSSSSNHLIMSQDLEASPTSRWSMLTPAWPQTKMYLPRLVPLNTHLRCALTPQSHTGATAAISGLICRKVKLTRTAPTSSW